MEDSTNTTYTGCRVDLGLRRVINESLIERGSFLFEICILYNHTRIIQTPHGSYVYERRDGAPPTVLLTHITQTQARSSDAIDALVASTFRGLESALEEHGVRRIRDFLKGFTSTTLPGTPTLAMVQVLMYDVDVFWRDHAMGEEDPSLSLIGEIGTEGYYPSEFKDYLVDGSGIMELVKYKAGVGGGTCAVCLDDFENEAYVVRTACSHYFHKLCIGAWMIRKATCPMCRSKMCKTQAS